MSVLEEHVIDAIGVENASGQVILTIADHLDWVNERTHLLALKKKLNAYVAFVESGEIDEAYPDSSGRKVVIDIVGQFPISKAGRNFVEKARRIIESAGIDLRTRHLE